MFYSQTLLARKGPLGTVWRAAHQQHLKKSQYTSTDICSAVDRIMFPEVPIALRMSAFLLLGVVRIYSKKVEFLSNDCIAALAWLRRAFASIELSLPKDARQAPFQSITLPERFDLDSLDLGDGFCSNGDQDNHLRSREDITLAEQIPIGKDPYVAISFDEDILADSTIPNVVPDLVVRPTETDFLSPSLLDRNTVEIDDNATQKLLNVETPHDMRFQDSGRHDQSKLHLSSSLDQSAKTFPEIEVLCDTIPETGLGNFQTFSTAIEPPKSADQTVSHNYWIPTIMEENLTLIMSRRSWLTSTALGEDPMMIGQSSHPLVLQSGVSPPELALQSTPPKRQCKMRSRKRKQFFDESTVLTNKFMKKSLKDYSDLMREGRNIGYSSLGLWKVNNILRKEHVLYQSLVTGLCSELHNLFDKADILAKPHLIASKEDSSAEMNLTPLGNDTTTDSSIVQSPASPPSASPPSSTKHAPGLVPFLRSDNPMEIKDNRYSQENNEDVALPKIEHLRHVVDNNETMVDLFPQWSTPKRDDPNPMGSKNFSSPVASSTEASSSTRGVSPCDDPTFSGTCNFEFQTAENNDFLDIADLIDTADPEDLYFQEADRTPTGKPTNLLLMTGSPTTRTLDSLSVRTRAVSQYIKSLSPKQSEDKSQGLSLNKIVQEKTRKLCARLFYELLVLKSYGLVDVHQNRPYADINVQPLPKLSKGQI